MKRYRLVISSQARASQRADSALVEHPDGEWVKYSDVNEGIPETDQQENPTDE